MAERSTAIREPKPPKMYAYCGIRPGVEKEHVIPRCLFCRPLPQDMLTVMACTACNTEKKADDEYLRDMMVVDVENARHPVNGGPMRGTVTRAFERNQSVLARDMRANGRVMPKFTAGGLYLGDGRGMALDDARVNRMFGRITRGLCFKLCGTRLPADCRFEVGRIDNFRAERATEQMRDAGARHRAIGQDVFGCLYMQAKEDPVLTIWLQQYYNVLVCVTTDSAGVRDSRPPEPRPLTSFLGA